MKPRVAFFDFTSCEGCQLDVLNQDAGPLLDLLAAVDIVTFREAITERDENYDIAFIEGSISREREIPRLEKIRKQAKVLVALGACACIGGVNCLKNHLPMDEAMKIVYGDAAKNYDTMAGMGISVYRVPKVERDRWATLLKPYAEELLSQMDKDTAKKIRDITTELDKKYPYTE